MRLALNFASKIFVQIFVYENGLKNGLKKSCFEKKA